MPGHARSIACRCADINGTCAYCLKNAPPYFYTSRTQAQVIADEHRAIAAGRLSPVPLRDRPIVPLRDPQRS